MLVVGAAAALLYVTIAVLKYRHDGAPNQDEEAEVFRSLRYASGEFRPTSVAWGALSSYLLFALYGATYVGGRILGVFSGTDDYLRLYLTDPRVFYLVARGLYAAVGLAVMLSVGRVVGRRCGTLAGVASAAAIAFLPLVVTFATTVKSDLLASLLGLLAVFASLPPAGNGAGAIRGVRRALLAGGLIGCAIGVKYHLAFFAPGIALGLWSGDQAGRFRRLLAGPAAAVLLFVLCNPFVVLAPGEWFLGDYGLFRLFGHPDPRKAEAYSRSNLWEFFLDGVGGILPAVLLLGALAAAAIRRDLFRRVLVLTLASFLVLAAAQSYAEPHHILPALPLLAVLLGAEVGKMAKQGLRARWLPAGLLAALLATPGLWAVAAVQKAALPNTTAEARRWIESNIPAGSRVLLDWAYVPTMNPAKEDLLAELEDGKPDTPARESLLRRRIRLDLKPSYRLTVLAMRLRESQDPREAAHFDLARYRRDGVEYAVISDAWYGRFFRDPLLPEDQHVRHFYSSLRRDFPVMARFEPEEWKRVGPSIWVVDIR